jgi:hypothetical protein
MKRSCRHFQGLLAGVTVIFLALVQGWAAPIQPSADFVGWPKIMSDTRPWTYWWWMGSAVDKTNITRELQRYHDAGLGGVHIIPIYGAKGFEDKFIDYLSPKWMEMLAWTVSEAKRLDMGVDMTTGTGWCFGGPSVTDADANALVVTKTYNLASGEKLKEKIPTSIQALVAFSVGSKPVDLTARINSSGEVDWTAPTNIWRVYAISQKPSGQKVKRSSPGGEGHMLNLFYPQAMDHYMAWFDQAFAKYTGPKPRAMYHDSYEYRSDWSPDLFAAFEKRRGYRLQNELPALFADKSVASDAERIARVKCDYRQTISEVMAEESLPLWADWARQRGMLTRNEAHGSPGNLLDLYSAADIPETEMFHQDRNKLVCKFASSAAHVTGKRLASSETGTWLKEHFTETLADVKYLFDDMFLSGINHMFYHGACYSPYEAGWPGWHFYASLEMNPRNSIWHDAPAVNAYAARCQSVLQSGRPDNDILLYWPIHDYWHNSAGMAQQMTIDGRGWFDGQPISKIATQLWDRGYAFDYCSDHQLTLGKVNGGKVVMPGGEYRVILVPPAQHLPIETLQTLLSLAESGATILFADRLPTDVPGWGDLENRRAQFKKLLSRIESNAAKPGVAKLGKGMVLVGEVEAALTAAGVPREPMFDQTGIMCVRRAGEGECYYFIANRSEKLKVNGWVPLSFPAKSVVVMDPMSGRMGNAALRPREQGNSETQVLLSLEPGDSVILRCLNVHFSGGPRWTYWNPAGEAVALTGTWQVSFREGGPELPAPFESQQLISWTGASDPNAQRFAGTALYSLTFDAPDAAVEHWRLDLGKVCQSARVRLNGQDLGTLITPPFRAMASSLKPKENRLEVEVTNLSANRIRDLDRRGVKWKNFYDINFVDINYKSFDASKWPLTDSGLIGPVTLTPVAAVEAK